MYVLWRANETRIRIVYIIRQLKPLSTCNMENTDKPWRLSPLVRPEHYNLLLRPDLNKGSFYGAVRIDLKVKETIDCLMLNSKLLSIIEVMVYKEGQALHITKFSENKELEQLQIHFQSVLIPGEYQISINYNGLLTNGIVGLYLSHLADKRYSIFFSMNNILITPVLLSYHTDIISISQRMRNKCLLKP